jgi:hypothetical protein
MFNNQGSKIVEFIINRIDERLKKMQVDRLLFINTISLEELKRNKSAIIRLFIEVEDDLKQSSQALSSLLIQNKDLIEERDNLDKSIKMYEQNTCSLEKIILGSIMNCNENINGHLPSNRDIEINNQKFINVISDLEEKLKQNGNYIHQLESENKELKEKIGKLEEEINKIKENKGENDNEIHYKNPLPKVSMYQHYSSLNNSEDGNKDIEQDLNYFNYLKERQEKKKLINQVIKDNLSNYEDDYNENEKLDTIVEKSIRNEQDDNNELIIERRDNCIRRINDNLDSLNYLEETLGIDFLSKLLSPDVNCSFLDKIEKAMKEYQQKK